MRKFVAEENKERRCLEKLEKERKGKKRAEEQAANKLEKAYWEKVKHDGWGDKLHDFIKRSAQDPSMVWQTPKNLAVPSICRYNQRVAMLRAKFKKEGKDPRLVVPVVSVEPYVHVMQGSQPPWFLSSSRGLAGGNGFDEVPGKREVGSMEACSRPAFHPRSHMHRSFLEGGSP